MGGAASFPKRLAVGAVAVAPLLLASQVAAASVEPGKAPPFPTQDPSRWVGEPVKLEDLRGNVVLLDVWTFG